MKRFNEWLALKITSIVSTMWTAYVFGLLALMSLPAILEQIGIGKGIFPGWMDSASLVALIAWLSSNFLQLVLLPIIMVGQDLISQSHQKSHEHHTKHASKLDQLLKDVEELKALQQKEIEWIGVLLRSEIARREREGGAQPKRRLS